MGASKRSCVIGPGTIADIKGHNFPFSRENSFDKYLTRVSHGDGNGSGWVGSLYLSDNGLRIMDPRNNVNMC